MNDLGMTIKFIRTSKNISQEKAAKHIMSRSNLSRFESGNYAPSYEKVLQLVTRLSMTLEEVLYIHYGYQLSEVEVLYQHLVYADNTSNLEVIQTIAERAYRYLNEGNSEYELLFYTSQCALQRSKQTETLVPFDEIQTYVKSYLSKADNWFIEEFRLLNNFLDFFDTEDIIYFMKNILDRFFKYDQLLNRNNIQVHLPMNAGIIMLKRNMVSYAKQYFTLSKTYALKQNKVYQVMICECYLAIIMMYSKTDVEKATSLLKQNLSMLERWGYVLVVQEIETVWATLLK